MVLVVDGVAMNVVVVVEKSAWLPVSVKSTLWVRDREQVGPGGMVSMTTEFAAAAPIVRRPVSPAKACFWTK